MALRVVFPTKSSGAADRCAREILETVPLVMRVVRSEMRRQGALVESFPQFRALALVDGLSVVSRPGGAKRPGLTAPPASPLLARLVRRRLVGWVPVPE